jgi:signal transduction histidine kinase
MGQASTSTSRAEDFASSNDSEASDDTTERPPSGIWDMSGEDTSESIFAKEAPTNPDLASTPTNPADSSSDPASADESSADANAETTTEDSDAFAGDALPDDGELSLDGQAPAFGLDGEVAGPASLDASLRAVVHNSLLPITTGLSVLYLVQMFTHVVLLSFPNAAYISLLAAGSSVGLLLLRILLEDLEPTSERVHLFGGVTAGLAITHTLWLQQLTPTIRIADMALILVGCGFVLMSTTWFMSMVALSLTGWLAVTLTSYAPSAVFLPTVGVFSAAALGTVVHIVRRRTNLRAERLRLQGEQQRQELRQALAANEQHRQSLVQRTEQVRALSSSLTMAKEKERRRIARVLHDDLQQVLYAAEMNLQHLQAQADFDEDADLVATEAKDMLDQAIDTTRSLSANLSPPVLEKESLKEALSWLSERVEKDYDLSVTLKTAGVLSIPEDDLRILLFNLVRELLFNVVKHAETDEATVEATETSGFVRIVVADEGVGFDTSDLDLDASRDGMGLGSVRERLEALGGELIIESTPGEGTTVTLRAPIDPDERLVEVETIVPEPLQAQNGASS